MGIIQKPIFNNSLASPPNDCDAGIANGTTIDLLCRNLEKKKHQQID